MELTNNAEKNRYWISESPEYVQSHNSIRNYDPYQTLDFTGKGSHHDPSNVQFKAVKQSVVLDEDPYETYILPDQVRS